jgi:gentisate 1,2-dioxygenase
LETLNGTTPRPDGLVALELVDARGGPMTRTIGAEFLRIPAYGVSSPTRQTGSRILVVAEGTVEASVNGSDLTLRHGDTLAVPSWAWLQMRSPGDHDSVLFVYDEAPTLEALGLYRKETRSDR